MPAAFLFCLRKFCTLVPRLSCLRKYRTLVSRTRPESVEVDQLCVVVINVFQLFLREDVGLLQIIRKILIGILRSSERSIGSPHHPVSADDVSCLCQRIDCLRIRIYIRSHDLGHCRDVEPDICLFEHLKLCFPLILLLAHRSEKVADHDLKIRASVRNAQQSGGLMALHQDIADVQCDHAVVLLDHLVDLHHSVSGQIERIVAAHETAAGADFELDKTEVLLLVLASGLARRKFLLRQLEEIGNELDALQSYLSKHRPPSSLDSLLDDATLVNILKKELPAPEASLAETLDKWVHEAYEKNPEHPENLIVPTVTGEMVRSKSEAMILMLLEYYGIPYRYECRLDIGRKAYYPDFTIRHPITGETFYWEHVGMLDKHSYRSDFLNKLHKYINNGLIPDHNLILTYESDDHPLDIRIAIDKIREFLLYDELQTI